MAGFVSAPVVFAGTAFGHVATGTPASLPAITRADLAAIHDAYWRPDNAILVLTGDITADQGFALAEKAFGGWARPADAAARPPRAAAPGRPRDRRRRPAGHRPGGGDLVKPGIARSDPRYYPGLVANAVLGGGYSARLNEEIRIKRGLSYGAELAAVRPPHPGLVHRPGPDQERVGRRGGRADAHRARGPGRQRRLR